jgi:hypothetical protein
MKFSAQERKVLFVFTKKHQSHRCFRKFGFLKQHASALEMYIVPFKSHLKGFFTAKKSDFLLGMSTFRFFSIENNSLFYLNSKICFVSFWFRYFFADIERKGSYFAFDHSEERIKRNISFRYRNELKIRSKKLIGFMHVDITNTVMCTNMYLI